MDSAEFYRGGSSLEPRIDEVKVDRLTGLLRTTHGVSVFDNSQQVERFGGAYRLESIPETLCVTQRGRDLRHYEVVPAQPMTWDDYMAALREVMLVPVDIEQERKQA
jgi:hypothetical protein